MEFKQAGLLLMLPLALLPLLLHLRRRFQGVPLIISAPFLLPRSLPSRDSSSHPSLLNWRRGLVRVLLQTGIILLGVVAAAGPVWRTELAPGPGVTAVVVDLSRVMGAPVRSGDLFPGDGRQDGVDGEGGRGLTRLDGGRARVREYLTGPGTGKGESVAVIACNGGGGEARIVTEPTGTGQALQALESLSTGGGLADVGEGIALARQVVNRYGGATVQWRILVVSDQSPPGDNLGVSSLEFVPHPVEPNRGVFHGRVYGHGRAGEGEKRERFELQLVDLANRGREGEGDRVIPVEVSMGPGEERFVTIPYEGAGGVGARLAVVDGDSFAPDDQAFAVAPCLDPIGVEGERGSLASPGNRLLSKALAANPRLVAPRDQSARSAGNRAEIGACGYRRLVLSEKSPVFSPPDSDGSSGGSGGGKPIFHPVLTGEEPGRTESGESQPFESPPLVRPWSETVTVHLGPFTSPAARYTSHMAPKVLMAGPTSHTPRSPEGDLLPGFEAILAGGPMVASAANFLPAGAMVLLRDTGPGHRPLAWSGPLSAGEGDLTVYLGFDPVERFGKSPLHPVFWVDLVNHLFTPPHGGCSVITAGSEQEPGVYLVQGDPSTTCAVVNRAPLFSLGGRAAQGLGVVGDLAGDGDGEDTLFTIIQGGGAPDGNALTPESSLPLGKLFLLLALVGVVILGGGDLYGYLLRAQRRGAPRTK